MCFIFSCSTKEDDRIKKMREEAMKQRRKEAGAVKLPHVPRSECRVRLLVIRNVTG